MKVLVCGSRTWHDGEPIATRLSKLPADTVILHGDAPGADRSAAEAARRLDLEVRAYPADWKHYGRKAGILRNLQMLDEQPELVLAFQHGRSRGTQFTIDEARKRDIPVEVCRDG